MGLARLVHQHIQMLQAGKPAKNSGLPDNAGDLRYLDVLVYLIKHWGLHLNEFIIDRAKMMA